MNNRQLNFKDSKKNLPILCPDLGSLEDALADGNAFKIFPRLEELGEANARNADVHRRRTGMESLDEMLREEFHSRRLHADASEAENNRRLLEIYRAAKLSIEENGANTLYLALGFLAWYETKSSPKRRLAPIILIPLEIERRSIQEGFSVKQGDDEPMVNVTLLAHLAAEFELVIPGLDPIPRDEHGIDVTSILRKFREAIVEIDRWEVLEMAYVGHFSFTKFLMWRDLEVRADDLQKNAIVRHLIQTPSEVYPDDGVFPDPDRLDETHRPEETFCPLSSDSSQLAAVHAAAAGKSFVLHGPPGTGKSQTITNIIAHNLASGKTVLFVSEKRAALEVVHRRLLECGLGPFCLELHSNKSHKKEVLGQLEQSLNVHVGHSAEEWLEGAQKLAMTRRELNAFVSALHAVRDSGETVFHGLSQLIGHREIPLLKFAWPSVTQIDRPRLNTLRETVRQLQLAGAQVGHPATNVWSGAGCETWTPEFRNTVEHSLDELRQAADSLAEETTAISFMVGMKESGWSKEDLISLTKIAGALLDCPSVPTALLTSPEWDNLKGSILNLVPHGRQRDCARQNLFSRYGEGLLALDLDELSKKWGDVEQARFLPQLIGYGNDWCRGELASQAEITTALLNRPTLPTELFSSTKWEELKVSVLQLVTQGGQRDHVRQDLISRYGEGILALDLDELAQKWAVVEQARFLPKLIGYGNDWSKGELDNQSEITSAILNSPSLPTELLSASMWEALKVPLQKLIVYGRKCETFRQNLISRYDEGILALDLVTLAQQWAASQKMWFLSRWSGCGKIRKALSRVALPGHVPQCADILADLELALALLKEQQALKSVEVELYEILDQYWRRDRSNWEYVRRAFSGVALPCHVPRDAAISAGLEQALALRMEQQSLITIEAQFREILHHHWHRERSEWEYVRKALAAVALSGAIPQDAEVTSDLELALTLRNEEHFLSISAPWASEILGQQWKWDAAERCLERTDTLRKVANSVAGADTNLAIRFCHAWAPLVINGDDQLAADSSIGQRLQEYGKSVAAFMEKEEALTTLLGADSVSAWGPNQGGFLSAVRERCDLWLENINSLRAWCRWRTVRREALALNLQPLVEAYEAQKLPAEKMPEAFTRGYYQWWCDAIIGAEPALCGFFSAAFEDKIRQFKELDDKYTLLTRKEIQSRVAAKLPPGQAQNPNSEMGLLRRQLQMQRAHLPVRSLIQKIPNLLPRLKPCLLMSPISVAQYLDPSHAVFDLVIFDEASQIPVWDAVGAIARGREAIIVGDPKQLPPTNFFSRTDSGDGIDVDDTLVEDLESILDDCIAAQLPQRHLNWHYRSRHESLIAFSNYHYYGNRLLTFPSPHQELGVSFRHVVGEYDKGKSRTNRAEATAVVGEVLGRLLDPQRANYSIGIVTFSQAQQQLIDDLLEETRRQHPEIEPYFADGTTEPVFIKNLENVQGDERDVILFSICYGPDATGRVSMNFGPMNRDGGERRLNVAITRARQEVIVFSTLRAEQIDLTKTRSKGVADFKCFLDYAERGSVALAERRATEAEGECESPFEIQVCDALRDKGYTVHPQVGCSGYRVDLGIVDPERPGRYLLGIECDGANYHRAKTARDRDKLREGILIGLGWTIHRVWSSDWWEKPADELVRIEAAIEAARQAAHAPESIAGPTVQTVAAVSSQVGTAAMMKIAQDTHSTPRPAGQEPGAPIYDPFVVTEIKGTPDDFYDVKSDGSIRDLIEAVVYKEWPVSLELVARRVAEHWSVGRVTARAVRRIEVLAGKANVKLGREGEGIFCWPLFQGPDSYSLFRIHGKTECSRRDAEHLPAQEIANAALHVVEQHISLPVAELVRETARLLGYQRTGAAVDRAMRSGINLLLKNGAAKEEGGMVIHQR